MQTDSISSKESKNAQCAFGTNPVGRQTLDAIVLNATAAPEVRNRFIADV